MIMELQGIFQEFEHELVDPEYWKHILRELRIAFSSLATPEILRGQIEALRDDDSLLRVLLISNSDYGTLEECCGVQAAAFDFLIGKEPGGKLMARYLAVYILRFWNMLLKLRPSRFIIL